MQKVQKVIKIHFSPENVQEVRESEYGPLSYRIHPCGALSVLANKNPVVTFADGNWQAVTVSLETQE